MSRLKVKECIPDKGSLICRFESNGKEIEIIGTLDKDGQPIFSKEFSGGVDPKTMKEAEQYTIKRIKARRGEF